MDEHTETKAPERQLVANFTNLQLIENAARTAPWKPGEPRWAAVRNIFLTGKTTAAEICVALGLDPDEVKPRLREDKVRTNRRGA